MGISKKYYNKPIRKYITEEDNKKYDAVYKKTETAHYVTSKEDFRKEIVNDFKDIQDTILRRYIKGCNNDLNIILQDTYNEISSLTIEGQNKHIELKKNVSNAIATILKGTTDEAMQEAAQNDLEELQEVLASNYKSFVDYATTEIKLFKRALVIYFNDNFTEQATDPTQQRNAANEIIKRIEQKYIELYPNETPQDIDTSFFDNTNSYLPMLHGKATDTLSLMVKNIITDNKLSNKGIIEKNDVTLEIDDFNHFVDTLGISTHKLLSVATANFTQLNDSINKNKTVQHTEINIPLKEYASKCGFDVEEHPQETEEAQLKEKKRATNELKNARKKIKKDLSILYKSSLSWHEKLKGKEEDYIKVRILEYQGIKNGYIKMSFTQTFSEYLLKLPMTQYPIALLGVDERNPNAYNMGKQMSIHANMDNNIKKGTSHLLKVNTLLNYTVLPNINDIRKQRASWDYRIKEPFEKSLDALTACGLLEDWEYSKPKGEKLTDKEATSFKTYEEWADTLIYFTLKDAPDHTERLKRNEVKQLERANKGKNKNHKKPQE